MSRETRIIVLPDGRELAWHEFGDPHGTPVVLFHGTPGTGRDFELFERDVSGVRMIAPDRPGYGHSSDDPHGTLRSWTDDVARLADHLALGRFAAFGVSGGGPYAVASARFLTDRLSGCAIVSSIGPPGAVVDDSDMLPINRTLGRILQRAPRTAPYVLAPLTTVATKRLARDPARALEYMERSLPQADRDVLARDDLRRFFLEMLSRPVARGVGRAVVRDYALTVQDWGFRLEDITMPVHIWHGRQDRNAPFASGAYLAERIPHATFHVLDDAGHMFVYERFAEILASIR